MEGRYLYKKQWHPKESKLPLYSWLQQPPLMLLLDPLNFFDTYNFVSCCYICNNLVDIQTGSLCGVIDSMYAILMRYFCQPLMSI